MGEKRLSIDDGRYLIKLARKTMEKFLKELGPVKAPKKVPEHLKIKRGVFCTLYTYPEHKLRGCIGIPYPYASLARNLIDAACSATKDPRFPQVTLQELGKITIEISVLTKPEQILVKKPQEYLEDIVIGKDGLIIKYGFASGLLLPQVPVEQKWDVREFLQNLCMKAALPPDTWVSPDVKIYKFQAQIFAEKKPGGEVEEIDIIKKLGSKR